MPYYHNNSVKIKKETENKNMAVRTLWRNDKNTADEGFDEAMKL